VGFRTLIQIIDMSDKMLFNAVKAEHSFLTLINATVSHELRNPLASLIA
jgi:signal transduction histidine kinase